MGLDTLPVYGPFWKWRKTEFQGPLKDAASLHRKLSNLEFELLVGYAEFLIAASGGLEPRWNQDGSGGRIKEYLPLPQAHQATEWVNRISRNIEPGILVEEIQIAQGFLLESPNEYRIFDKPFNLHFAWFGFHNFSRIKTEIEQSLGWERNKIFEEDYGDIINELELDAANKQNVWTVKKTVILLDPRLTIDPKWRLEKDAIARLVGYDALLSTDDFFRFISRGKDTLGEIESSWKVVRNGVIREVCKGNPETERFLTKSMHQSEIDRIKDGINSAEEFARKGRYDLAAAWAGVSLELMLQVEFGDEWPVKLLDRHPERGPVPAGVSDLMYKQRKRIAERWGSPSGPLVKPGSRTVLSSSKCNI